MRYRIARFSPKHTPVIYTRESMPCSLATDVFVTLMLIRLARVLTAHEQRSVPETFFFSRCLYLWNNLKKDHSVKSHVYCSLSSSPSSLLLPPTPPAAAAADVYFSIRIFLYWTAMTFAPHLPPWWTRMQRSCVYTPVQPRPFEVNGII